MKFDRSVAILPMLVLEFAPDFFTVPLVSNLSRQSLTDAMAFEMYCQSSLSMPNSAALSGFSA